MMTKLQGANVAITAYSPSRGHYLVYHTSANINRPRVENEGRKTGILWTAIKHHNSGNTNITSPRPNTN